VKTIGRANDDPAFFRGMRLILMGRFDYSFLNFLLTLARPISPDPNRIMVAGSGVRVNNLFIRL
jgi:hypothetical protein